jgi:Cof subfamily protein (haloacid dehalogenase superfamily)
VEQVVPKVSLVVADVDGTLVTRDKVLTAKAQAAVEALHAKGVAFAITSGRPPKGMAMLIEPLAITTPIGGFNGAIFVKPDMTIIEERVFAVERARETIRIILDAGLDAWVYTGTDWLIRDLNAPHVAHEQWVVKFAPKVVADLGAGLDHAVKITGISDDHDMVARCEAELRQKLGARASVVRSQPYYIDVTHPDANKGVVVDTLSRVLSIPPELILTIGDMPSDTLMFRKSGISIAMGNAEPEVKAQAHYVTDSNEAEGFATAMERFVLDARDPA